MELKEYLKIIKRNKHIFGLTVAVLFLMAAIYIFFRPISYTTSLTLNITRDGTQSTDNYKYDNFYRLQADEKFSETLVEWLRSPRIEEKIFKEAGIDTLDFSLKRLSNSIKAEKMSSQIVSVSFSSPNKKSSQDIAQAVSKIIIQNTQELNRDQKDATWFKVLPENPVVKIDEVSLLMVLAVLFSAFFAAFWVVMIKHYLE
jgi:capsular polysaccharide biosynthesis protein